MSEKPEPSVFDPDQRIEQFVMSISARQKENTWTQLFTIYGLNVALLLVIIFVFYQLNLFMVIDVVTLGLVNETFVATSILLVIVIWLGVIRYCDHDWNDIGVNGASMKIGYITAFIIWVLINMFQLIIGLIVNGKVLLNPSWGEDGFTVMIGYLLSQVFGVAIQEELLFRGYLFPQLTKKMSRKYPENSTLAIFLGIILANTLFSLMHLPIRIYAGNDIFSIFFDLFVLLGLGVLFTFIYILTENIWIAIGVHALGNATTLIFSQVISADIILYVIILILCIIWPQIEEKVVQRFK